MNKKQIIGRIVISILVAGGAYLGLNAIEKYRTAPIIPTISVESGSTKSTETLEVFVPDMHEFTLQPGGSTVTIQTNGRPFSCDGNRGKWLVQIENRKGVKMSPSGRVGQWDVDWPGKPITTPHDIRSISFYLPEKDGLLINLPIDMALWYLD